MPLVSPTNPALDFIYDYMTFQTHLSLLILQSQRQLYGVLGLSLDEVWNEAMAWQYQLWNMIGVGADSLKILLEGGEMSDQEVFDAWMRRANTPAGG